MVNSDQFAMFFIWHDDVYAANENSRLIYANMLHPSKDMPNFDKYMGMNISAITNNQQPYQRLFTKHDNIHIINKEEAMAQILNGN